MIDPGLSIVHLTGVFTAEKEVGWYATRCISILDLIPPNGGVDEWLVRMTHGIRGPKKEPQKLDKKIGQSYQCSIWYRERRNDP